MTTPGNIFITGASRGIGRATALALATPGARLTLAARSAPDLADTAAAVEARGAEVLPVPCDVTIEEQVRALVARAAAPTGRLDVVVHSVGGAVVAPFDQIDLETWEAALRVQLTSLFLICKYASAQMEAGGLLINIASVAARQAFPGWAAYSAAKHGALGFLNAVREELRPRGIRVTSVLPAATDTDLWASVPGTWDRARMLRSEDVAAAIATLVGSPPYVTVEELLIGHVAGRL